MINTIQKKEQVLQEQLSNIELDIASFGMQTISQFSSSIQISETLSMMTASENDSSSSSISFFDKYIGALICNDIGSTTYNNVFEEAKRNLGFNSVSYLNLNDNQKSLLSNYLKNQLQTSTDCNGYEIIDFVSEDGFDGGIYEKDGEYVVVCRGTEFKTSNEELYRDFITSDVLSIGRDNIPKDFEYTLNLLRRAEKLVNNDHSKIHIVSRLGFLKCTPKTIINQ